jgi:hypothetical protein
MCKTTADARGSAKECDILAKNRESFRENEELGNFRDSRNIRTIFGIMKFHGISRNFVKIGNFFSNFTVPRNPSFVSTFFIALRSLPRVSTLAQF